MTIVVCDMQFEYIETHGQSSMKQWSNITIVNQTSKDSLWTMHKQIGMLLESFTILRT